MGDRAPNWVYLANPASWAYRDLMGEPVEHNPRNKPRIISASSNVNPLDESIFVSGNSTLTLETAVGCDGRTHTFVKTDSGTTLTIACTGSETIDGAATISTGTQYSAVSVRSDGSNWFSFRIPMDLLLFLQSGSGAVSRSAQAKIREIAVTPQDFGATGVSTQDATTALNNAYSRASSIAGELQLPPGEYRFTSQLTWNGRVNVRGIGRQEQVTLLKDGAFDGVLVTGGGQYCVYENFMVGGVAGNTSSGIRIDQGHFMEMRNVISRDHGLHGVHITNGLVGRYIGVLAVANGGDGIRLEPLAGGFINSNTLINCEGILNTGVGFNHIAGDQCVAINLLAEQNTGGGIKVSSGAANSYQVYLESNSTHGLKILSSATRTDINLLLDDVLTYQDDGLHTKISGPGIGSGYTNVYGLQPPLPTSGAGRDLAVIGGHASSSGNGGNLLLRGGDGAGAGVKGLVDISTVSIIGGSISSLTYLSTTAISTGTLRALTNISSATVSTGSIFANAFLVATNISSATVSTGTLFATDVQAVSRVSTASVSTASLFAVTQVSTLLALVNTNVSSASVSTASLSAGTQVSTGLLRAVTNVTSATVSTASLYAGTEISTALARVVTNVSSATVSSASVYATAQVSTLLALVNTNVSSASISTASLFAGTQVSTGIVRAVTNVTSATVSTASIYGTTQVSTALALVNTNLSSATVSTASIFATWVTTATISSNFIRVSDNISTETISTARIFVGENLSSASVSTADLSGATRVSSLSVSTISLYATTYVSTAAISTITLRATSTVDISGATAGQIKFPATQNSSADANTLDDYEEGTWTPIDSSGGSLSFTNPEGFYTKNGNVVTASFSLTYPVTADVNLNSIGGLPFTSGSSSGRNCGFLSYDNSGVVHHLRVGASNTVVRLSNTAGADSMNSVLSGAEIRGCAVYSI